MQESPPKDRSNPQAADTRRISLLSNKIHYKNVGMMSFCHLTSALTLRYITRSDLVFTIISHNILGLSITMGLHRLWTHTSYETTKPIKYALMLLSTATGMNSIEKWCSAHRMHHQFEDSNPELDPYSITEGFFNAHIGCMLKQRKQFFKDKQDEIIASMYANEWKKDEPMIRWQQKHYARLATTTAFIIPISFSVFVLGNPFLSALGGCFLRIMITWHCTFLVNSLAHWAGDRPFTERHSSHENWIVSLLAFGEGYHNYHHSFPKDYRASRTFIGINPTAWLLEGMRHLGLVWDCKYVADADIVVCEGPKINYSKVKYVIASPSIKSRSD